MELLIRYHSRSNCRGFTVLSFSFIIQFDSHIQQVLQLDVEDPTLLVQQLDIVIGVISATGN